MKKVLIILLCVLLVGCQSTRGDINNDGQVNDIDIELIKSYLLGGELTDAEIKRADLNGNGKITLTDMVQLKELILGGH